MPKGHDYRTPKLAIRRSQFAGMQDVKTLPSLLCSSRRAIGSRNFDACCRIASRLAFTSVAD
jgi:hypothetical protein